MTLRVVEIVSGPIEGGIPTTIRSRLKYAPSEVSTLLLCPFTSWIESKAPPESFPCDVLIAEPGMRGVRNMASALRKFRPNAIIAHTERDLWWALALRTLARIRCPITYLIHNDAIDARPMIRRFVPLGLRAASPWTKRVIAVAGETRDGEQGRNFRGVLVYHQPPDLPTDHVWAAESSGNPGPVFLIVKRLVPSKGVDRVLTGAAQVQDVLRSHGCQILIAGDGPERENLELQVAGSQITDLVRFRGWSDGLAADFQLADYFVQPSIHEGASMSLVEAMHAGLRIASSPKGLARDVLDDDPDCTLFDAVPTAADWAQWFQATVGLPLPTPAERQARSERSRLRFDPKRLTELFYSQLYEDAKMRES